jgi:BASS family bile acid:Na+ symporter
MGTRRNVLEVSVGLIGEVLFALLWAISFSITVLFVATRMFHVGLRVQPAALTALTSDRRFIARALFANIVVVPAVGVLIALILPLPADVAVAIVLVAAVGGGIDFLAPAERRASAADVTTALVFALSIVAIVISPIVRVLLQPLGAPVAASLWRLIAVSALAGLVPLIAGVLIRRTAPAVAGALSRAMASIALVLFVTAALTTFLLKASSVRNVGASGIVGMVVLIVVASGTGWLLGGPSADRRALLARVTATRNIGLSLLLAIVSFPDAGADVAVLVFVVVGTALRLLAVLAGSTTMSPVPIPSRRDRKG